MKKYIMIVFMFSVISGSMIAMSDWDRQQAENRRWAEQRQQAEQRSRDQQIQQARVLNQPISAHTYMGASPAAATQAVAHNAQLKK